MHAGATGPSRRTSRAPQMSTSSGTGLGYRPDTWHSTRVVCVPLRGMSMSMLTMEEIFPPFGLRITSGAVEMRVMRDQDIPELVELIHDGIQAPDLPMPFLNDWHA